MQKNSDKSNKNVQDNTIDISSIILMLIRGKELIIKSVMISFILGCIFALLSPVVYQSQTTFVPQTSDNNSSTAKGLGSLASLAGINLNAEATSSLDNYISPMLYSKIIESEEFSLKLIEEEVVTKEGNKNLKEYIKSDSFIFNPISFIKKYTIGLFLSEEKVNNYPDSTLNEYNFISEEDFNTINEFKKKFSIEINEYDGYIKVIATDKNAFVSTQIVQLVTKNLQAQIISLRTKKIKEQLDFTEERYKDQKINFERLQNKFAEFRDSNKNINTAVFLSEYQKLESEVQLQKNILMNLASEYNNNKIKLNKDTPIFSVLDEVSVPNKRSKPKRGQIVLLFIISGIILPVIYLFSEDSINEIFILIRK